MGFSQSALTVPIPFITLNRAFVTLDFWLAYAVAICILGTPLK